MRVRGNRGRRLTVVLVAVVLLVAVCGVLAWWAARDTADDTDLYPLTGPSEDAAPAPEPPLLKTQGETPANPNPSPIARRGQGRVRGVVLDSDDQPVAGVPIVARRSSRYGSRDPFERLRSSTATEVEVTRAVSDAHGRFLLEGFETTTRPGAASPPPHYVVEGVVAAPRTCTRALLANWVPVRTHTVVLRVLDGVAVQGRVVDAKGRPVSAVVRAEADSQDRRPLSGSAWGFGPQATDAEGRFTIAAAPLGASLRFDVSVAGRVTVRGLRVQVPEKGELIVRIGAENAGRVTGRVATSDGTPIARAQVLVDVRAHSGGGASYVLLATTDEGGAFLVPDVAPGMVERLTARAAGHVDRSWRDVGREVRPEAVTHFELTLLDGATLRGRVLDEQGAPVAAARVVAHASGPYGHNEAVTDAEGRYVLTGLTPRAYQLYLKARGYYDPEGPTVHEWGGGLSMSSRGATGSNLTYKLEVKAAGEVIERDFHIKRGLALAGVVLAKDGSPAVGAMVRWRHQGKPRRGRRQPRRPVSAGDPRGFELIAVTDEQGRFQHPGLGPLTGAWIVAAHTDDACSASERIASFDNPVAVTLRLRALGTIRGRVVDASGQPVPRITVRVDAKNSGTVALGIAGGDGRFEFDRLASGSYELHAMARVQWRWRTLGSSSEIALVAGQPAAELEIHVVVPEPEASPDPRVRRPRNELFYSVEGTVLAPDGSRVESGHVNIRVDKGRGAYATILRGTFTTRVDLPATTLSFEVSDLRDREGRLIVHAPFGLSGQPVDDGPFTLKLEAGGVIVGRVEDDEGNGIADVSISIGGEGRRRGRRRFGASGQGTRTAADGSFRLQGLAQGAYRLKLEPSAEFIGPRDVSASTGDTAMRIRFARGGVIAGQVLGPDGEGIANVELAAMPADRNTERWVNAISGSDGRFRFVGLTQAAIYTVRARPWERDVGRSDLLHAYVRDLRPGSQEILLRLQVGVFLEGVVLAPDGSPATGQRISAFGKGKNAGARSVKSDGLGAFRIGPFAPGASVNLTAFSTKKTVDPATLRDVIAPASGLTLRFTPSRVRHGRVAGENLAGFQFAWTSASKPHGWRGPVEADGTFILNRLPAEGTVTVTVYVYGRTDDRYALAEGVKTTGDPLQLRLVDGLSVKGTLEESLRKQGGAMIVIRAESISHGFFKQAYATKDGSFHMRGLPPGRYVLHVHAMGGKEIATLEVEAGADDVVLR